MDSETPTSESRPQAVWTEPVRPVLSRTIIISVVIGVLAFLLLAVVLALFERLGGSLLVPAFLAALVPLAAVLLVLAWVDRWEPEPRRLLLLGFLWGAGAAVILALLVDAGLVAVGVGAQRELVLSVVQAPLVEEFAKGLGLMVIFLVARRQVDGPLDGLVYGAVIASGFAFTENIIYFADALASNGPAGLGATFVVRAVISPFAHVVFSAVLGLAWGVSIRSTTARRWWWLLVGYAGAVGLHALWNGALFAVATLPQYVLYVTLVQIPLFAFAIWLVVLLRREEVQITRERLSEYQQAGWFTAGEVHMLASWSGRRQASAWARTLPGNKRAAMQQFTTAAVRLAFTRQRILTGTRQTLREQDVARERVLLGRVVDARQVLLGP
ncbi:protease PrsW [Mycetocola reblochoni]|uniref:Protease PrsW n=3 Tax=Mycetocola reblochoni TaxID=331618 RepID=A0A3L6ZJR5_9MICO|nr:protease PrsW [Mycetocola reblochoni]SJN40703.1 putative membrane protein [Mycetocola reblochoni REB411]